MSTAILAFLSNAAFFGAGNLVWFWMMDMVYGVLVMTPDGFSSATWNYVSGTVYPVTLSVGVLFLNFAFLAGFFRQAGDIKRNLTLETLLELGIRVLFANVLMQGGLGIMQGLFRAASGLTGAVGMGTGYVIPLEDVDAGMTLFGCLFGILYFLVCAVCGAMVFMAVYGRFLQLFVMVACAPLALPFLAGGQGMERTGAAFIRSFFGKCFEIVAIALFMGIGNRLCGSIDWGSMEGIGGWFDGAGQCLQNMVVMVLMTASVKGADSFMRRVFGL